MTDYILSFDVGSINMSYCVLDTRSKKIVRWGVFSIKDSTHEGSCTKLATSLNELNLTNFDQNEDQTKPKEIIIVIELQPRCNIKTLVISGQLQMYYVLEKNNHKESLESSNCKIKKIVSQHARQKLQFYKEKEGDAVWPERITKLKKGHYQNKQIAIEHCRRVLGHTDEDKKWIEFFESSKKKDDLSDSYLQARIYIQNNKCANP